MILPESLSTAEADALAHDALRHWGADAPPRLVKNRENIVYDVTLPGPRRAALRLHRPGYQSRESIAAELRWTAALAASGLPVPMPIPTLEGGLMAEAGGRRVSCVAWIEGVPIGVAELPLGGSRAEKRALMAEVGDLVARLHDATDALGLPADLPRPVWDATGFLGRRPLWGPFWENPAFSAPERAVIGEARALAGEQLAGLSAADRGLIHADVLRENLLRMAGGGLALIDFDDSGWGFRLYDLATAIVQSLEEPDLPAIAAGVIEGYRRRRPLDEAALPLFVMLRCFASAGWIATRAAPEDPRQRFYAERAVRMARHLLSGTAPWG